MVFSVSKVKVNVLQGWDLSQLDSNYVYPLWDVRSDQSVLVVLGDVVAVNDAIQRHDIIR
jgi:hypothetical protein